MTRAYLSGAFEITEAFEALPHHLGIIAEDIDNTFTWDQVDKLPLDELRTLRKFFKRADELGFQDARDAYHRLADMVIEREVQAGVGFTGAAKERGFDVRSPSGRIF